jgi:hypothetical protein
VAGERFGNENRPGGLVPTRFIPLLRQGERVNNVVVVVVADIGSSPLLLVVVAKLDCFDCDNTTIVRPLVGPIGSYYGQNHAGRWQKSNNKRRCPARDRPFMVVVGRKNERKRGLYRVKKQSSVAV